MRVLILKTTTEVHDFIRGALGDFPPEELLLTASPEALMSHLNPDEPQLVILGTIGSDEGASFALARRIVEINPQATMVWMSTLGEPPKGLFHLQVQSGPYDEMATVAWAFIRPKT